jgi:hypothetical protein
MDLKVPAGGFAAAWLVAPQHAASPSVLTPHTWDSAAETAMKEPAGGFA